MAEQRWVVTLSGDRPLEDVRRELASAGFKVDEALGEIGILIGRCGKAAVPKLRSVAGVADVAGETPIDIGPPGSPTTW